MNNGHKKTPTTIEEIGIHLGYMSESLEKINKKLDGSPDRREFEALKEEVKGKVNRKEVGILATTISIFIGIITFIVNIVRW